jgi:hypothetical protein
LPVTLLYCFCITKQQLANDSLMSTGDSYEEIF